LQQKFKSILTLSRISERVKNVVLSSKFPDIVSNTALAHFDLSTQNHRIEISFNICGSKNILLLDGVG